MEGRDWLKGVPESPSHFPPTPALPASCCFCPGLAKPPPLPLFFPIPPSPLQTLGKNEVKHTNQEGFSLHCVFQLDLNRRRSIQPSLTLPPLFFSRVLFVLFLSQSVSSGLGKSSSLPAAGGDKQHQLPAANTTWLSQVPMALGT